MNFSCKYFTNFFRPISWVSTHKSNKSRANSSSVCFYVYSVVRWFYRRRECSNSLNVVYKGDEHIEWNYTIWLIFHFSLGLESRLHFRLSAITGVQHCAHAVPLVWRMRASHHTVIGGVCVCERGCVLALMFIYNTCNWSKSLAVS